jgi:hypothetical protein
VKPNNLAEAERRFAEAKAAVERQHEIIDALGSSGPSAAEAERALVSDVAHQPLGERKYVVEGIGQSSQLDQGLASRATIASATMATIFAPITAKSAE